MSSRRPRSASAVPLALETLEGRIVLSTAGTAHVALGSAHVASKPAHNAPTQTTLAITPGTLGQPIVFHATVHASASAGPPVGTVNILQSGQVIGTATLSPQGTVGKVATSSGTFTLEPQIGGQSAFFGKYQVSAQFVPATHGYLKSTTTKVFTVPEPTYVTTSDGVKIASIATGSGPTIQPGQTATVMYTGYLASTGSIFDSSLKDGGTPFTFKVGGGQVIPGFDQGVTGMQVGETRVVEIPAAEAYGAQATGSIPANSTLIFVLTLQSITGTATA